MAPPSKITLLPTDLRDELVSRIIEHRFSDYDSVTDWLNREIQARGIDVEGGIISRSAVHREGQKRKSIAERMRDMKSFQDEFGHDQMAFVKNGNNVIQMLAYQRSRAAMDGEVTVDEEFLKDMSLALGRMAKTAAINDDRDRKIREDERNRAREEAAEKASEVALQAGVSPETVERIRRDVLGMG